MNYTKNESLLFAMLTIDSEYFLEGVGSKDTLEDYQILESNYWLGKFGSDKKVWIGKSDTMTLEMAEERARKMIERGIRVF